jgi:hypothetical protein
METQTPAILARLKQGSKQCLCSCAIPHSARSGGAGQASHASRRCRRGAAPMGAGGRIANYLANRLGRSAAGGCAAGSSGKVVPPSLGLHGGFRNPENSGNPRKSLQGWFHRDAFLGACGRRSSLDESWDSCPAGFAMPSFCLISLFGCRKRKGPLGKTPGQVPSRRGDGSRGIWPCPFVPQWEELRPLGRRDLRFLEPVGGGFSQGKAWKRGNVPCGSSCRSPGASSRSSCVKLAVRRRASQE